MMSKTAVATPVVSSAEGPTEKIFIPLSKDRLERFKDQLLEISQQKIEVAVHLKETLQGSNEHVFGTHQEWGTDTQLTSVTAIQQDHCDRGSMEVNAALIRIQSKSYGRCKTCKGNIEEGRLEALPTTEICGDCSGAKKRI